MSDRTPPPDSDCPVGSPDNCPFERRKDDPWRHQVTERIDAIDTQIAAIRKNTDEIVEFFQAGKGFFTIVRGVGALARWLAIIAAACGIAYGIVKFGIGQILADLGVTRK